MSTRDVATFHGHGARIMDSTLQRGSSGVDGGRSEEVLDEPQGGQDSVQDSVPHCRGFVVHGRVKGAQEGGGTEAQLAQRPTRNTLS